MYIYMCVYLIYMYRYVCVKNVFVYFNKFVSKKISLYRQIFIQGQTEFSKHIWDCQYMNDKSELFRHLDF